MVYKLFASSLNRSIPLQDLGRAAHPKLCDRCSVLTLKAVKQDGGVKLHWEPSNLVLYKNLDSFIRSKNTCPLCNLLRGALGNALKWYAPRTSSTKSLDLLPAKTNGQLWFRAFGLKLGTLQVYAYPGSSQLIVDSTVGADEMLEKLATSLGVSLPSFYSEKNLLPCLTSGLRECIGGHMVDLRKDSDTKLTPPLLPRRVLDLGVSTATQAPKIRLYETGKEERGDYVTLSYRWGKDILAKTTTSNASLRMGSMEFDQLPITFKDVITITREMGFRYLWIDAICIIQDDGQDWASHAPLMGSIFRQSVCTIAAHCVNSPYQGLLSSACHRSDLVKVEASKSLTVFSDVEFYVGLPPQFDHILASSHILQRGWIQQELMLSPRLLHIFSGQAYWECQHNSHPQALGFSTEPRTMGAWQNNRTRLFREGTEESWMEFISHYTTCDLSYQSDRLAAIDGLSRLWIRPDKKGIYPTYRFGHFTDNPKCLLWAADCEVKRKEKDIPTWSWASVDSKVYFLGVRSTFSHNETGSASSRNWLEIEYTMKAITLSNQQILLQAATAWIDFHPQKEEKKFCALTEWPVWIGGTPTGYNQRDEFFCFDHAPDLVEYETEVYDKKGKIKMGKRMLAKLLLIHICTFMDENKIKGFAFLILQPGDHGTYKRVGMRLSRIPFATSDKETIAIM